MNHYTGLVEAEHVKLVFLRAAQARELSAEELGFFAELRKIAQRADRGSRLFAAAMPEGLQRVKMWRMIAEDRLADSPAWVWGDPERHTAARALGLFADVEDFYCIRECVEWVYGDRFEDEELA